MWHTVRGDLRNPDLGPLPKACVASMRLRRVELCFNSSFTVVSELDNDADMSAFVRAMVRNVACLFKAALGNAQWRHVVAPLLPLS